MGELVNRQRDKGGIANEICQGERAAIKSSQFDQFLRPFDDCRSHMPRQMGRVTGNIVHRVLYTRTGRGVEKGVHRVVGAAGRSERP